MKTKVILTSFALATITGTMFVSCTNEELIKENDSSIENQYGLIELGENFMIGAVGHSDATSRTHWELQGNNLKNIYLPLIPKAGESPNTQIGGVNVVSPSIGLCWVGNGSVGEQVYTNYEFFHYGWLAKDEKAIFDKCDGSLLTGWTYNEFTSTGSTAIAGEEIDLSDFSASDKTYNEKNIEFANLNLNSGVYKTCNKAIFGGNYIAYYPFNSEFKDAGAIPAKSMTVFGDQTWGVMPKGDETDLRLSYNTFRYSNVEEINGGTNANGFGFTNLSGVVRIVLTGTAQTNAVKRIILYSENGFIEEALISPAKIAEGKTGEELYSSIEKRSKTITITMKDNLSILDSGDSNYDSDKLNECVYITALPTTVKDLKVLVQNNKGEWAECNYGDFTINAGKGAELIANVGSFNDVYYATTSATLKAAIGEVASGNATIKLLGDVTLESRHFKPENNVLIPANVIVEGGSIIIPEGAQLIIDNDATIDSDIVVKGQTCCNNDATTGGKLFVGGAILNGDVTVEDKEAGAADSKLPGAITLTGAGTAEINANLTIAKGNLTIQTPEVKVKGAIVLNNGSITSNSENTNIHVESTGSINTKGNIEVKNLTVSGNVKADGDLEINTKLISNSESSINVAGIKFANNTTGEVAGKLTLNGNSIIPESAVVNIKGGELINGEDGVFEVMGEFNVLDASGSTTSESGKNMENKGTFIDHVGSKIGGATQSMINKGDYICKVADDARIDEAYQNKAACNIIEIIQDNLIADFSIVQQHKNSNGELFDVNIIVSATGVHFNPSQAITVGNITVSDGKGLRIRKTENNAYITVNGDITSYGNFIVSGDVENLKAKNLYVKKSTVADKKAQFENRVNVVGKTMEVSGTISVEKGANFIIDAKGTPIFSGETGKNIAYVTCTKLVEGGTFSGKPIVVAE